MRQCLAVKFALFVQISFCRVDFMSKINNVLQFNFISYILTMIKMSQNIIIIIIIRFQHLKNAAATLLKCRMNFQNQINDISTNCRSAALSSAVRRYVKELDRYVCK